MVKRGDRAPDFTLPDQNRNPWKLSANQGKKLALVFFPFAFSSVCQAELCALRDDRSWFDGIGAEVIGISCDSPHALRAWAEQQSYEFPLLSDRWPLGEVSKLYGAFDEKLGCSRRVTIVIGPDGMVIERIESPDILTPRELEAYHSALSGT